MDTRDIALEGRAKAYEAERLARDVKEELGVLSAVAQSTRADVSGLRVYAQIAGAIGGLLLLALLSLSVWNVRQVAHVNDSGQARPAPTMTAARR